MCNRFIEDVAWKVAKEVAACDCVELKSRCRFRGEDFQLTNKSLRRIFTQGEFYGVYGYDYATMFTNFKFCKEFVDMALCYLHEGDLDNFHTLVQYLGEYTSYADGPKGPKIDDTVRKYAKDMVKKHLHCIPNFLLNNHFVHVGFGPWNERDELFLNDNNIRMVKFTKIGGHQEYMYVSFSFWLYIFLTEEKPRAYFHDMLVKFNQEGKDRFCPDIPHIDIFDVLKPEKLDKLEKKFKGDFNARLCEKILEAMKCNCLKVRILRTRKLLKYKNFEYVPRNVRDIFKTFNCHGILGFYYNCCQFRGEENENKAIPLFADMALNCLYEKDFQELINIVSDVGKELKIRKVLRNHIHCISYNDVKKYRVNIDMQGTAGNELYVKDVIRNKTKRKRNERDFWTDGNKCTDHERYNVAFSDRYFNISLDRWLSDVIAYKDPRPIWKGIWKRGLKNKWTHFL